jgi:hypothetical protein
MIEIISIIGSWLICTIASERAAEAITTSVFFSPMRQFLARTALMDSDVYNYKAYSVIKLIGRWASDLVSCGWCTSLWTSLFFSFFLPGEYISSDAGNNIIVKVIALWGFANLYHAVFRLVHNGRVAAVDINLKIIDSESNGDTNGEFGEGVSQENTSGIEPQKV